MLNLNKKPEWLGSPGFGLVVRFFLGVVFIYASLDKIQHPAAFAKIIDNYRILPLATVNLLAIFLPWLEIMIGAGLILGIARFGSSFLLNGILLVFIVAIMSVLIRGLDISCGCFSTTSGGDPIAIKRLLEDLGFLVLGVYLWLGPDSLWQWRLRRLARSSRPDQAERHPSRSR